MPVNSCTQLLKISKYINSMFCQLLAIDTSASVAHLSVFPLHLQSLANFHPKLFVFELSTFKSQTMNANRKICIKLVNKSCRLNLSDYVMHKCFAFSHTTSATESY